MARAKQEAAQESAEVLAPGTNVIARAKGYPAWPAIVVNEEDVPSDVRKVRPSKKVVIPVLFYNDNSFLWISPAETEPLSREQALKNSNAKIKRTLKDAYALAADPPTYENLVAIATGVEPAEPEPEPEPAPKSRRARSAAEKAADAPQRSRKRGRTTESPPAEVEAPATARRRSNRGTPVPAAVVDDEDDEEYVDNGTEEESASTSAETEGFGPDALARSQGARLGLCSAIRESIQQLLVSGGAEADMTRARESLAQLTDAPEIEICVARRSRLLQVLVYALTLDLPDDLRAQAEALVSKWSTKAEPVIRGIPEDLAPKEETEEPEDYDESVDASREPTPRPFEPKEQPNGEPKQEPSGELAEEPNGELKEEPIGDTPTASQDLPIGHDTEAQNGISGATNAPEQDGEAHEDGSEGPH